MSARLVSCCACFYRYRTSSMSLRMHLVRTREQNTLGCFRHRLLARRQTDRDVKRFPSLMVPHTPERGPAGISALGDGGRHPQGTPTNWHVPCPPWNGLSTSRIPSISD
ncbi:hypothetical protein PMIN06_012241 [Paraphaeosphaeria minitans]